MTKCLVILTMVLIIQLFFSTSVNANVCSSDGHCQNLGICKRSGYCRCEDGYSGARCNISASKQCGPNATCLNGGYCGAISQYCRCADGWTGDLCNIDINECLYNYCHNGGTCNDLVADSTCTCADGYRGSWCSYQINECLSNPCQNGATCNDFFDRFTCNCRAGFLGTLCQTDINECASNPCQNGGTCNDNANFFNCTCVPGYNGSFCETDIDECASNPCQNGGTCNDTINAFNCTCLAGYNGTFCETDIDECASNPCQNGGTCNETINLFNCTCPAGYNGTFCETDIDECASNPCQNGGTCNDSLNFFNCTCPAGYNGTFCETDIDECASNPCQNGGTCNHTINFFNCTCPAGYNGTFCETDIDECASNPCQNGGTCNDSLDFFNCTCPAGYNGTFCETDIDECASNPCQNGGTCNHTINAFNCTCPAGYNGTFCETDIDECASNPCQNGGTCNHTINAFNCTCPAGYNGTFCETDVDDCASNPCQNGGTCNDNLNFFNCTCPAGYNGTFCETDIDECASNPCQNGGTCNDFVNSFNCTCLPGYNGTFCEPDFDECLSNPCQNGATCNEKVNSFNCTCPEMYTGVLCEIDVGFVLVPLSTHVFGQPMSVEWNMTEGANLTVTVFYNEIPCCNSSVLTDDRGRCICLVSDSDSFDTDGVVDIRAVASNLVFSATKTTQVEVLKKIINVSISVLTTDTDFKSRIGKRGNLENIFPTEYPVTFNFSYVHGPLRLLEWTLACSISGVTKYTQFFFDKVFPGNVSQRCNITLVVKNNVSTAIASRSIELKESIVFTSMTTDGPKKENQTISFIISFEKFGTDTCMTVDLGDNSSLLVFGGISCETKFDVSQINPNIVTNPRLIFSENNSKTRQIVVHHRYRQPGTYLVNMNVSNDISMVTENTVAVVLGFDCKNPNVTITGLTLNSSNTLNAARVYRSVPIALSTENQLSCEKTRQTTTSWTVFKFNDDPRNTLNVESLRKTPYHTDRSSPDLLLPERYLPYGFYQVSARVEMQDLPDVFGSDLLYLQVVQTPWIKAAVTSGSFYTVPFGNLGSLNASNSFDPDFVGTDGMIFSWYCRDVDDDEFLLSNLTHEVLLSIPQANESFLPPSADSDGCFGTGRGHLNETKYLLELDTRTMVEDKTYTISLVVLKNHPEFGLRQDISNIYFYVAKGVPPELHASCTRNCRDKIVPDKKIILESSCSKFCYGELQFSWSLYYFDDIDMLEPYNLTDLNVIERDQLQKMASNPIEELNIAIKSNVLQSGRKYIMSFRATRPNGVYGELRYTMLINTPPQNGNCSVFPLSGVALETKFTFSCEKWNDPDSPLTFEFSYKKKEIGNIFSYRTVASGQRISVIDWLPNGDEHDNYRLNVSIDVKDNLGSKTTQVFTLKVVPPSLDAKKLQDISGNIFDSLMQSNGPGAISLASSVGSVLNYMVQNVESNATVMDQSAQKEAAKQIRAHILTSLSTISPKDMSSLIQMSGAVSTLTEKTDELLPEAQDAALKICGSLADSLKGFSDGDTGFENVQKGASKIVGVIGQIMDGFSANAALSTESGSRTSSGQTKSCIHLIEKMQNTLLDNLVTNEGAVNVETNKLSLQVERVSTKELGNNANTVKNSRFLAPLATSLGLKEIVMDPNNTYLQMQAVDVKMAVFDKNPFSWDRSSKTITSFVVDVVLESKLNISSNFSEEITITLPRDSSQFPKSNYFFMKPSEINTTTNTKQYLKFHCFTRNSNYTSMNFELRPDDLGIHFTVYVKKGSKPDIKNKDFDMYFELPDFNGCTVNDNDVSTINMSDRDKRGPIHIDPKNCSRHPYTVFISNIDFNGTGKYCFAVEHVQYMQNNTESDDNNTPSNSRRRRSVSCEVGKKRVRRSCVVIPTVPPKPTDPPAIEILVADNLGFDGKFFFPNQTPNYNLTMFESSCVFWDVVNERWIGEGCRVASGTNKDQIVCYCNHLTSFGSDLLVAPNPIDFDSVFKNFDSLSDNVAVLILISVILGFYIIGVLWARRADNKDLSMLGPKIVHPEGSYSYLITLYTGQRQEAGTTARVVFKMSGSEDDTSPVRLRDRRRPCFKRGQDNAFVVSYPQGVGDLNYVQIWHDNSGSSPSWYLSRLSVKDLQTGQMWSFVCENWLAVECEDGQVCRVLPVASDEERINFRHLFTVHTIKGLSDGHIWFSIVSRPPSSNFTRVQRLSCALCLLCSTMITSAMFYNMGSQGPSPFLFHIGSLVIDLKPFVIGLQSSIIIVPINVALVQIFRNLRPKEEKKSNNCSVENDKDDLESQIEEGENLQPAKGKLPYWFIYIAYGVCYLTSATAIFFTLLYSIQWGKTTSRQWVIAMVTAFFQSVFLLQPIKVALGAIILALVIRKPCDTDEKCSDVSLNELTEKEKIAMKIRIKTRKAKYYSPPDPAKLKRARIKRLKEIKMNAVLKEIVVFFVFLVLLMEVAHHHRDPNTFLMTKTLTETFEEVDAYSIDLAAISDEDSLWMWARETLIPGLYAGDWYNGAKSKKGYIANMQGYLVGVPRIRLLRVKKDSCRVTSYFKESIPHCYTGYSITDEEDQSFNVGWQPLVTGTSRSRRDIRDLETEKKWLEMMQYGTERYREKRRQKRAIDPINSGKNRRKKKRLLKTSNPKIYVVNGNAVLPGGKILSCLERWRHQTMTKLRGFPYWGTIAMYSGGGYVANLGYEPVVAYTVVADLHSNGWIDVQTRAVFVEFTVYNANTNLFGIISIFIEFPSSSSAITRVQYQVARFYLHMTAGQTLAHVLVIFFMLYFLYREGKFVYKQRWAYFKSFWNWVETILVFCEFATVVLFLARLYEVDQNLIQLRENPNDYVGFQYAGNADAALSYVLGVLVFFYILRFLRLFRFNKNFLVIGKTLSRISKPILSFCIPFFFGFVAFGLFAFSIFGSELEEYSSFVMTMVTQFSMTLGDFDFEALVIVNPLLAPLYFFAFIGLNVIVLMNVFLAIINDSYAEIQKENTKIENEYEILDFVTKKFIKSIGWYRGKGSPKKKDKKRKNKKKSKDNLIPASSQRCFDALDRRAKRLDKLIKGMERDPESVMEERFLFLMEIVMEDDDIPKNPSL